jgi:hypothetical protein
MLSVGSFTAEDIGPPPPGQDGHKLWIISRRRGHDDAILQLNGPGGQHRLERRKSGASWTAGVEQFYAGSLSVAESGIYRLRITVGRDTMCVRVHYRALIDSRWLKGRAVKDGNCGSIGNIAPREAPRG